MHPTRLKILCGVAAVLLVVLVWKIIVNWGLVTIHENDASISSIIRSIEKQGGITLISNADPSTTVTMHVDKATPAEAVALLADWMDANWSVTYVAAGDKGTVETAIANLSSGQRNEKFRSFRARGGDMMFGEIAVDPRKIPWNVSPSEAGELQSYLSQFSQKTGASATVPEDWNPAVTKTPKGGKASSAVRDLVKSVGGTVEEIFYVRVSDGEDGPPMASAGGPPSGGPPPMGRGDWDGRSGDRSNPEWETERVEAQLAQLPTETRERVRTDMNEMRNFQEKIRNLPEAERRAEIEKMFNDPMVQERMMEREASREGRRSPEHRADRFRRYIERKMEMQQASS